MSSTAIFPTFQRFRDAVTAFNGISSDKLGLALSSICKRAAEAERDHLFTVEETSQLQAALALADAAQVHIVTQAAAYVFERAAALTLKAPALLTALAETGLDERVCKEFANVWVAEGAALSAAMKTRAATMGAPLTLRDVNWEISLGMGSSAATAIKEASGVIELELERAEPAAAPTVERVAVEFSRSDLLDFLGKLDIIQQQIDSLSA